MNCGSGISRPLTDSEGIRRLVWYFLHGFAASPEKLPRTFVLGLPYLNHIYALFFSSGSFV